MVKTQGQCGRLPPLSPSDTASQKVGCSRAETVCLAGGACNLNLVSSAGPKTVATASCASACTRGCGTGVISASRATAASAAPVARAWAERGWPVTSAPALVAGSMYMYRTLLCLLATASGHVRSRTRRFDGSSICHCDRATPQTRAQQHSAFRLPTPAKSSAEG
jgi:hypothetical protein